MQKGGPKKKGVKEYRRIKNKPWVLWKTPQQKKERSGERLVSLEVTNQEGTERKSVRTWKGKERLHRRKQTKRKMGGRRSTRSAFNLRKKFASRDQKVHVQAKARGVWTQEGLDQPQHGSAGWGKSKVLTVKLRGKRKESRTLGIGLKKGRTAAG